MLAIYGPVEFKLYSVSANTHTNIHTHTHTHHEFLFRIVRWRFSGFRSNLK